LELARLAARAGDAETLRAATAPLPEAARSWPEPAQAQLRELQGADAAAAATRVSFLKNVLLRAPEYRRALAAVTAPRGGVGEPLMGFLALPTPSAEPAAPDMTLAFDVKPVDGAPAGVGTVIPDWPTGDGSPEVVAAGAEQVMLPGGALTAFPG